MGIWNWMLKTVNCMACFCIVAVLLAFSNNSYSNPLEKIDFGVGAYVDGGRLFIKETWDRDDFFTRTGARWNITGNISEQLNSEINLHWLWWRNHASSLNQFHIVGIKFDADLEASLNYQMNENNLLKFGLYEFKYNPDSKNLGEYLIRSEAYPLIIENGQGKDAFRPSHARVGGIQFDYKANPLYARGLIFLEQTNIPANDLSIAIFGGLNTGAFDLEIGASSRRLLKFGSVYQEFKDPDTVRLNYIKSQGLTTSANVFMVRGAIDLYHLMGVESKDKFKFYMEAALLGLKTDSLFYTKLSERLPIMAGIDIPSFSFFDELAFEIEYLSYPHKDKKYLLVDQPGSSKYSPLPPGVDLPDPNFPQPFQTYHRDDWKWSLNIAKNLNNWVGLRVKLANDHFRLLGWDKQAATEGEALNKIPFPGNWHILMRLEWHN